DPQGITHTEDICRSLALRVPDAEDTHQYKGTSGGNHAEDTCQTQRASRETYANSQWNPRELMLRMRVSPWCAHVNQAEDMYRVPINPQKCPITMYPSGIHTMELRFECI
ncbi:unnamed protein product, partial [Ilex paraguariensis]